MSYTYVLLPRDLLCTYFSKENIVYYRLQHRRVRVFASNVISLKGPLYNLKQSHVLHSRYFFENYFSPGTALLCLPLLYFRLTRTNSNSAGKVSIFYHTCIVSGTNTFLLFHAPTSSPCNFHILSKRDNVFLFPFCNLS